MKQQTQTPDTTKQYHIDCEFEGERLVDDVTLIERLLPRDKKALVYSPKLKANILIPRTELRPPPTKQSYVEPVGFKGTKNEWIVYDIQDGLAIKEKPLVEKGFSDRIAELYHYPFKEMNANAKLISQSKELAKALQDMIDLAADVIGQYNDLGDGENEDMNWQPRLQKAAQVLKEAGLTNE